MTELKGSKWYKFDFHTHTPFSTDFNPYEMSITPEIWLKAAMEKKLDCVAVTDHNGGGWIDKLKVANEKLKTDSEKPEWYRDIVIFPGAEITLSDNTNSIHLLAIFDPSKTSSNITAILGECGINELFGDPERSRTTKSFADVANIIKQKNGSAIAAHIDGERGLLNNDPDFNQTLQDSFKTLDGAEVCNLDVAYSNVELNKAFQSLTKVGGSDAHKLSDIGKYFSWVKMSNPTIKALKLALLEKDYSIKNQDENPNILPDFFITKLKIVDMKYCGNGKPFEMEFNSKLNTLIGGRGSGKSTMIEALRLVFQKQQTNINEIDEKVNQFYSGVVTDKTEIEVEFSFHDEIQKISLSGDEADIANRFPISIYSQKQIEKMADKPQALLTLIDETKEVDYVSWNKTFEIKKSSYMEQCERHRSLQNQLKEEPNFIALLKDSELKLKNYEEKGHGVILKKYQLYKQQYATIPNKSIFENLINDIQGIVNKTVYPDFVDYANDKNSETLRTIHIETDKDIKEILAKLSSLKTEVSKINDERSAKLRNSSFSKEYERLDSEYKKLVTEYQQKSSPINIESYGKWVEERNLVQQKLYRLNEVKKEIVTVEKEIERLYDEIFKMREELCQRRLTFINNNLGENNLIEIKIENLGYVEDIKKMYVDLIGTWELFPYTINKIIDSLDANSVRDKLIQLHDKTINIRDGKDGADSRFVERLKNLNHQAIEDIKLLLPEDRLTIKFKREKNGSFELLNESSSPGQKSISVLSFLLSYGNNPLIIDQPEDDLDNTMIYNYIVKELLRIKEKRQIIIATHNPNIVVNADSDLVGIFEFTGGQIHLQKQDGLDDEKIRLGVCEIMEGGEDAFRKRYNRIGKKNV